MENIILDTELQDNYQATMEGIESDEADIYGPFKTEIKVENFTEIGEDYFHAFIENATCEETKIAAGCQPILSEMYEIPISKQNFEISKALLQLDEVKSLPLLCRLCATQANDMTYIFGSTELEKKIANKIKHCLPIAVKQTDTLPKQVCSLCLEKLELCYQFHETVTQAEKQLLMFDEQTSGRFEEAKEYYPTLPQCNGQHVVTNDAGNLHTAYDGDENDSESSSILEKLLTIDETINNNNTLFDSKKNSKGLDNPNKKKIKRRSSSHKFRSAESFKEGVDLGGTSALEIKRKISQSAPDNPIRETDSRKKSKSDGDVSADSEIYSPPVTRSHRTSNCLREEASKDRNLDDIPLSGREATERHTSTGQSVVGESINCRICREPLQTAKQCYIHGSIHASTNYYPCCLCDEILRTEKDWNEHWTQHDTQRRMSARRAAKYWCDECGEKFVNKVKLKSHKLSHKSFSAKPCEKCGEIMDSEQSLKKHMLVAHSQHQKSSDNVKKAYSCFICGKELRGKSSLNCHMRIHTGERPFKCDLCTKTFITKQSRKEHLRMHTGERPFECPICAKTFTMARVLRRHANVHSENKSFECSLCDKSYKNSHSRTVHMAKFHA